MNKVENVVDLIKVERRKGIFLANKGTYAKLSKNQRGDGERAPAFSSKEKGEQSNDLNKVPSWKTGGVPSDYKRN